MNVKKRTESPELLTLSSLNGRMKLTGKWMLQYSNLEKGFEGERKFDEWLVTLPSTHLILNDLLLEHKNSQFQIDSSIICQKTIFNINVKNFEGDYYIDGEKWFTKSGKEINNPFHQLDRSESLLRLLLNELGYKNFRLEKYLVFINPEFHLYQAPLKLPMVFPTQINRFIHQISNSPSKISHTHKNLAEKIVSLHSSRPQNLRLPEYSYGQLKKGVSCKSCCSFMVEQKNDFIICNKCGTSEGMVVAVLRNADELKLLFPDIKITTSILYDWCQVIKSKKNIQRILSYHFNMKGVGRSSYYVKKNAK
ncbi:nuclease-related domain-containing protein [Alkalihalobacillus sp. AL-G]|uniref:nuclease-related domain-containing protein n=1 Tax=Alkalihalobacillus sp. AL-G TaxID=2926399 RepID=UPI00272C5ABF|nr:nuclease-related domain-containing protein [Alkalihalobacillus sp. AL-G]WLD91621.1 NERD domain-containing protein [Alkalihalobacillus sp. AL-G]